MDEEIVLDNCPIDQTEGLLIRSIDFLFFYLLIVEHLLHLIESALLNNEPKVLLSSGFMCNTINTKQPEPSAGYTLLEQQETI